MLLRTGLLVSHHGMTCYICMRWAILDVVTQAPLLTVTPLYLGVVAVTFIFSTYMYG